MNKVKFSNPHGLLGNAHHCSVQDINKIATYALKYDMIKEIVAKRKYKCVLISRYGDPVEYEWNNSNKLLNGYFIGVKTGVT